MRFALFTLVVGLFACTLSTPVHQDNHHEYKIADKEFLTKQKDILRLFRYVNQPSYYKDHEEIAKKFSIEKNFNNYKKPEVAQHFWKYYHHGFLHRGEIFSVFHEDHLKQAIALYKVFYYANDYKTFYETAVWARNHVNEGIYLYALSVAIVHREDTYGIVIPPIYEIYPYYFYNTEVIEKAHTYKQMYHGTAKHQQGEITDVYTINANYSGHYLNLHPEQSMSYFTEDVGINAFYYYYNIYFPFWLGGEDFDYTHEKRGELFYFVHQQILARYYLERLSNGMGEIKWFDWEVPFETGYYPSLRYANGLEFPTRPHHAQLHEYFYNYGQKWNFNSKYGYSYTMVHDYERRIRDAIDRGYVYTHEGKRIDLYTEEGFNTLGNMIECNADSPDTRFYGAIQVFARHLLGYSYQPLDKYKVAPSAMEHFETSMRDPAFYQFYKRMVLNFQKYKFNLPAYSEKDLHFTGVEVKNVEFDRLITYFDYFYSDISNAIYVTPEEYQDGKMEVRVRQHRLNHKPFTYKIHVNSDKDQDAVVRIYIGPKYDEFGRHINVTENRVNFVHFDHFKYHLKSGGNVIERNSHENHFYVPDRTSYREIYKRVLGAIAGNEEFKLDGQEAFYGFPQRYLLPKGTHDGHDYQFYVHVAPYKPSDVQKDYDHEKYYYPRIGTGAQHIDGYPFGYPFDRPIHCEEMFHNVPNSYWYSTKVYHRHAEDINASTPHHHH